MEPSGPENQNGQRVSVSTYSSKDQSSVCDLGASAANNYACEFVIAKDFTPYMARVLHDYEAQDSDSISLKKGMAYKMNVGYSINGC
ncbi:unnamed protein product [Gongylonema pulchrum]|uniref:Uncharacterized protein n=1 Tax=Gongylonema pulchrum TaxID=637853 RepID=A0A183EZU7_9BILA|nr:unnamed protein product [Gongylonema pulchrum]